MNMHGQLLLCLTLITGLTHTTSYMSDGSVFCKFNSTGRVVTSFKTLDVKTIQECCFRCISDGSCIGFNLISEGSLQCMLCYTLSNITCNSLIKKATWDYYEKGCGLNLLANISSLAENSVIPLCLHGSQCSTTGTGFKCICSPGFEGSYCEQDVNECDSSPCLNQGTCINTVGSFQCVCPAGTSGSLCEISACTSGPCKNGGGCLINGASFTCNCTSTHGGVTCEHVRQPCGDLQFGSSTGGNVFADPQLGPPVTGFKVDFRTYGGVTRASNFQLRYGSSWGPEHATMSSGAITVLFDADEYITGIESKVPGWCDSFRIFTNKRNYGPYGPHGSSGHTVKHCSSGERLAYISGRQGLWYNIIKFHFV